MKMWHDFVTHTAVVHALLSEVVYQSDHKYKLGIKNNNYKHDMEVRPCGTAIIKPQDLLTITSPFR